MGTGSAAVVLGVVETAPAGSRLYIDHTFTTIDLADKLLPRGFAATRTLA